MRDRLASVGVGQAHNRGHRGDGFDHLWPGNDDAGAGAGEAELREAECEDDVVIPDRCGLGENDIGEGRAVGVVDNQRDAIIFGELCELGDFVVGQYIAGRIGGAGHADRGDVVSHF